MTERGEHGFNLGHCHELPYRDRAWRAWLQPRTLPRASTQGQSVESMASTSDIATSCHTVTERGEHGFNLGHCHELPHSGRAWRAWLQPRTLPRASIQWQSVESMASTSDIATSCHTVTERGEHGFNLGHCHDLPHSDRAWRAWLQPRTLPRASIQWQSVESMASTSAGHIIAY